MQTRGYRFDRRGAMFVRGFAEGLRIKFERLQSELPEGECVIGAEGANHLTGIVAHALLGAVFAP